MVGWHHCLNGRESEQAPGDGEGQGSLARCSPCGHRSRTRLSDSILILSHMCYHINLLNLSAIVDIKKYFFISI